LVCAHRERIRTVVDRGTAGQPCERSGGASVVEQRSDTGTSIEGIRWQQRRRIGGNDQLAVPVTWPSLDSTSSSTSCPPPWLMFFARIALIA
jgi:hypothetical protein